MTRTSCREDKRCWDEDEDDDDNEASGGPPAGRWQPDLQWAVIDVGWPRSDGRWYKALQKLLSLVSEHLRDGGGGVAAAAGGVPGFLEILEPPC
eukprot:CAMPEP_0170177000 /NCGR_PEP_ID=MMETSP0040_2-20121228/9738_1 /TAXON_ID=641309 /ORGANISM="Lotharella oceanica, Strain CCMP622" /LENGTH=93 /DNA_ID=CAMNT_0010419487 /DNA_START=189 /DNA_END=469 /DNA_ORIENTATION=-